MSTDGSGKQAARHALRPLRERMAWFALVGEERLARESHIQELSAETLTHLVVQAEARILRRIDLLFEEFWRKTEGADARAATAIQELREQLARLRRDQAAVFNLVTGHELDEAASADDGETGSARDRQLQVSQRVTQRAIFDRLERGSAEDISRKLHEYLLLFKGTGPVVDLGCGPGEFVSMARLAGIEMYGVDLSAADVARAREQGLDARQEDLFEHLAGLEPGSIGGVFSAQVVEHLPAERIDELMHLVARALRSGGLCVIETPNPATFATHVQSFWRDPTHVRPVPMDALSFSARTAGLTVEGIVYTSRSADDERLQPVDPAAVHESSKDLAVAFNSAVERLNDLLYGYQDYALIAVKP